MRTLRLFALIFIILCLSSLWAAIPNPSWFFIKFDQYDNFWDNRIDLNPKGNSYVNNTVSFGQLSLRPTSWNNQEIDNWKDFTVTVTIGNNMTRIVKTDDPSFFFSYQLQLTEYRHSNPQSPVYHNPVTFPYEFSIEAGLSGGVDIDFSITIAPNNGHGNRRFGTYTEQIIFRLFDKDGDLVEEKQYHFVVHDTFKGSSPGAHQFTILLLEQYAVASHVDVHYLQQNDSERLLVGSVIFLSNEPKEKYDVSIIPYNSATSNRFEFVHKNNPLYTIPYKVT